MTEKEKKEYYRNRIERDLKGNPLAPNYRKPKVHHFPPPSQTDAERMKKLDSYGNPLPGYEWRGRDIVKSKKLKSSEILIHQGDMWNGFGIVNSKTVPKGTYKLQKNLIPCKAEKDEIDGTAIHRFQTIGITRKQLVLTLKPTKLKSNGNSKRSTRKRSRKIKNVRR